METKPTPPSPRYQIPIVSETVAMIGLIILCISFIISFVIYSIQNPVKDAHRLENSIQYKNGYEEGYKAASREILQVIELDGCQYYKIKSETGYILDHVGSCTNSTHPYETIYSDETQQE